MKNLKEQRLEEDEAAVAVVQRFSGSQSRELFNNGILSLKMIFQVYYAKSSMRPFIIDKCISVLALSAMLSRVFEASKNLEDEPLHHLIDALCKLSNEAMELAYSNREPSLFAVAKLLETGLANLHRIEFMWRPITNHLLEVCQHPHMRMREWGVEAITYLVQGAFQYHHNHPHLVTEARERLLLEPLSELSRVRHGDVRARQLECAARLLHSRGEQLGAAWPLMVNIVAAISPHHSEQLIRSAFQCCQLVAGDLLGAAGARCLRRVLAAVAAFARQTKDINISLTAVGLMWNISDYLYHNRERLAGALAGEPADRADHADLPHLDRLFMCLYSRLSELCTEPRAPVRRAASQTLFSCIGAHGSLLTPPAWRALLNALFPMLHKVQNLSNVASSEKVDTGEHILIHHTRNTAQKQWAETQVLTLSGVSRVFHSRFALLTTVGDFPRSWAALLDFITDFALRRSHEVSVAALKSFQEVLSAAGRATDTEDGSAGGAQKRVWALAWAAWANIAKGCANLNEDNTGANEENKPTEVYAPSQGFLTTLVQIFPLIFHHIRPTFTPSDVVRLGECLCIVSSVEAVTGLDSLGATPAPVALHALHCLDCLQKEALVRHELLPPTFAALVSLAEAAGNGSGLNSSGRVETGGSPRLRCLSAAAALYRACAKAHPPALKLLLQALHNSIQQCVCDGSRSERRRRSGDQAEEPAQIAALLLQVLATGLPLAREKPELYGQFWDDLPAVLETFMFQPPGGGGESGRELVLLIRSEVLRGASGDGPGSGGPARAAAAALQLVRKGSMLSPPQHNTDNESELRGREEFARTCFETLLQFSMLEDAPALAASQEESDPLAVTALLDRFREVIVKYNQDDVTGDQLARHQLSEISFVLKALATLAASMQRAPPGKVDPPAWHKLIGLYSELVCLAASARAPQAAGAIKEALLQYGALLAPPSAPPP
ncbi:Protein MON2 homolog [Eumeta japonica]|uniref:Protein MON2 homolog n=1 Tax=Eumeta variegata TaxID=151549 RepID=A0A4C1SCH1_EUMVA|nr:Protein MON2 homolog [Eumeta japonica]